jgi:hypothetical protein
MVAQTEYDSISWWRRKRRSARWPHRDLSTFRDIRTQWHVLDIKEDLAEVEPNGSKWGKHDDTKKRERGNTGGFLLLAEDREIVLEVIPNPEGTMDKCTKKQATTRPAMNVVKLFVTISWS